MSSVAGYTAMMHTSSIDQFLNVCGCHMGRVTRYKDCPIVMLQSPKPCIHARQWMVRQALWLYALRQMTRTLSALTRFEHHIDTVTHGSQGNP